MSQQNNFSWQQCATTATLESRAAIGDAVRTDRENIGSIPSSTNNVQWRGNEFVAPRDLLVGTSYPVAHQSVPYPSSTAGYSIGDEPKNLYHDGSSLRLTSDCEKYTSYDNVDLPQNPYGWEQSYQSYQLEQALQERHSQTTINGLPAFTTQTSGTIAKETPSAVSAVHNSTLFDLGISKGPLAYLKGGGSPSRPNQGDDITPLELDFTDETTSRPSQTPGAETVPPVVQFPTGRQAEAVTDGTPILPLFNNYTPAAGPPIHRPDALQSIVNANLHQEGSSCSQAKKKRQERFLNILSEGCIWQREQPAKSQARVREPSKKKNSDSLQETDALVNKSKRRRRYNRAPTKDNSRQ